MAGQGRAKTGYPPPPESKPWHPTKASVMARLSRSQTATLVLTFALLALVIPPAAAQAQPNRLVVGFHLHCFSGVAPADQVRLDYWSAGLARGNPDPDCVARQPLLAPVTLQRATLHHDDASLVDLVRLEVDPAQREAIDRALRAHLRKVIAITVQNRIVSTVFLTGSTADHRIPVYVADKVAAADLVSDLSIMLGQQR